MTAHIIGVTGTRQGMTREQREWFEARLQTDPKPGRLVHGAAKGVDTQCHHLVAVYHIPRTIWPSNHSESLVDEYDEAMVILGDWTHEKKPPLERNKDIVDGSTEMVAFPANQFEELRSGTWACVRYARKVHKPLTIVWPDGQVTKEDEVVW